MNDARIPESLDPEFAYLVEVQHVAEEIFGRGGVDWKRRRARARIVLTVRCRKSGHILADVYQATGGKLMVPKVEPMGRPSDRLRGLHTEPPHDRQDRNWIVPADWYLTPEWGRGTKWVLGRTTRRALGVYRRPRRVPGVPLWQQRRRARGTTRRARSEGSNRRHLALCFPLDLKSPSCCSRTFCQSRWARCRPPSGSSMPSRHPAERSLIARLGAEESWSRTVDRTARTANGRAAFEARFANEHERRA